MMYRHQSERHWDDHLVIKLVLDMFHKVLDVILVTEMVNTLLDIILVMEMLNTLLDIILVMEMLHKVFYQMQQQQSQQQSQHHGVASSRILCRSPDLVRVTDR